MLKRTAIAKYGGGGLVLIATIWIIVVVAQAGATTTTLTLSTSSVLRGTAVTLTAAVSNGSAVTAGTVTFCNASATYCDNAAFIGTAQLTSAGTAVIRVLPGIGSHSYKAVFSATTANAASTSAAQTVTVSGGKSTTSITAAGSAGNYTLTGTVAGQGSMTLSPTGSVAFEDTSNGNYTVGSAALGAGTFTQSLTAYGTTLTGVNPGAVAVADFNRDGLPDLAVTNYGSSANNVGILLGYADGTFQTQVANATETTPNFVAAADFNGDGLPDLAVINSGSSTISLLLNNVTQTASALVTSISIPGAGAHLLNANYPGDANFAASTSSILSLSATQITTTLALDANPRPSAYGQPVTLTATLTPAVSGGLITTGETVTFENGAIILGTGTLNASGVATLTLATLSAGNESLTAAYAGDTNFAASTSSALNFTETPSILTVTAQDANRPYGTANPTFTSTITGFVNGDTQSTATTGTSSITTTATSTSPAGTYPITAAAGTLTSSNYSFTFVNATLTINSAVTAVTVTSSGSPTQSGSAVTFTVTVQATADMPTGLVLFEDAGTILGTGTLNAAGVATFITSSLALGSNSITAVYNGDANSAAGTSSATIQVVQQATTTTAVSNNAIVPEGASITFTAIVAGDSATPTGSVNFQDGATVLNTASLDTNGTATFSTTALTIGIHAITAIYSGDAGSQPSTSLTYSQTVQEPTDTVAASGNNPSESGAYVILTSTITTPGTGSPTGSVTFLNGATELGSATLDQSFHASFAISSLPAGPVAITAVYSGDSANMGSTAVPIIQNVQSGAIAPLSSSSSPSVSGQPVTFTANIQSGGFSSSALSAANSITPTGTITFEDSGATLGSGILTSNGATASGTFTTSSLSSGTHPITAVYSGDTNNPASTSPTLNQIVEATTSVTLTTSANPSAFGNAVTFTANVPTTANGQPTGTVNFRDSGSGIGSATLSASGNATFSTSTFALGPHAIVAVYVGDILNANATSPQLTQTVLEQTEAAILSSLDPAQPGAAVTFTAALTTTGPGTPTGTVTFNDGGITLGTGTLSTTSGITTATYSTSNLSLGRHSITAVYSGDALNDASTSPAFNQYTSQTTTVALTSSSNPANFGSPLTLSAAVTSSNSSIATGSIAFKDGATTLGSATLDATGAASFAPTNLSPAQHSITASYSGDASNNAATSTTFIQTIQQPTTTALTADVNPSVSGNPVNLTATVTTSTPGTPPSGAITFTENGATLGSAALNASSVATLSISTLAVGSDPIVAVYAGNSVNLTSTSNTLAQTVSQNNAISLTATENPAPLSTFVSFTATLTTGSSGTPTGTVTFLDGTTTLGTATLDPTGGATFATQNLGLGIHSISANYSGDSNYPSSSADLSMRINPVTAITWPVPSPIIYGTPLDTTELDATASVPGTFVYSPATGAIPTAPTTTLSVSFTPTDALNNSAATATVTLTVNQAYPVVTWSTPSPILFGTALSSDQLDATAAIPGTFVYNPAPGTIPAPGNDTLSVTFTPTDTADYYTATSTVTLTVNPSTGGLGMSPITWSTPAPISFGTKLSSTQLNATALAPGKFVYTPPAGTIPAVGIDTLFVSFTPTDTKDFAPGIATVQLTVNSLPSPTITWPTPASITYGTPLTSAQLNATASVPGTFVYSPPAGITPSGGADILSVTFTPTDTVNYNTATATVTLIVIKATIAITWAAPAPVTYGAHLSATQLNAVAPVPGRFVYRPAVGSIPEGGTDTLSVIFTPDEAADYSSATATVSIVVNQAQTVMNWPQPAIMEYGSALGSLQLDATATGVGTFVYVPSAGFTPQPGSQVLSVTFIPTNIADYSGATSTVTVQIADFELTATKASSEATVNAGDVATFAFVVQPTGTPTFLAPVTLSISGLPPGATSTFSVPVVAAGAGATPETLLVQTALPTSASSSTRPINFTPRGAAPILLGLIFLPLLALHSRRNLPRLASRLVAVLLFVSLSMGAVASMTGCSPSVTGKDTSGPSTVHYTLQVTLSSGTLQQSYNLILAIKN